jgi:glycoprotein 6-alpha-L-fucosyltransferase
MAFRKWKRGLVLFIIAWIALLSYFDLTDFTNRGTEENQLQRAKRVLTKSQMFINKLQTEIQSLKQEVLRLQKNCKKKCPLVKSPAEVKNAASGGARPERSELRTTGYVQTESQDKKSRSTHEFQVQVPGFKLEKIQRRAAKELREMWYYLSAEVTKINKLLGSSLKARLTAMLDNFAEIHRALSNNLDKINNHEALLAWRKEEEAKLSKVVQHRLERLQNPQDCDAAKKLLCDLNKGCGYGCQVHHLLYCFITAYGTKRTLILNSDSWRYSDRGWEGVFLSVSNTCTIARGPLTVWSTDSGKHKNVQLPIVDGLFPQPKHLPLAVPADLVEGIQSFHGFPFVWWIGQFAKYLFRYQPEMKKEMDEKKEKLGFQTPIVG